MNAHEFWLWMSQNCRFLHSAAAETAVDKILIPLRSYDDRLSVEIGDDENEREMTITANGDRRAFGAARDLMRQAPNLRGWKFRALKPSRGFDFDIAFDQAELNASALVFEPLESPQEPKALGIRVYVPCSKTIPAQFQELVRVALQTGLGEESFAAIDHVQVVPNTITSDEALPIQDLGSYIEWFARKTAETK